MDSPLPAGMTPLSHIVRPADRLTAVRVGSAEVLFPRSGAAESVGAYAVSGSGQWVVELWDDGYFLATDAYHSGYRLEGILSPDGSVRLAMYSANVRRVLDAIVNVLSQPL